MLRCGRHLAVIIPRWQPEPEPKPSLIEKFGDQVVLGLAAAAAASIFSNIMMMVSVPEKLKALGDRVEVLVGEMKGYKDDMKEISDEVHKIQLDINTLKLKQK